MNILKIKPYTQLGALVLSSRTVFDWLAGTTARGSSQKAYEIAQTIILSGGVPNITIWLDTNTKIAQQRINERGYDTAESGYLMKFRSALADLSPCHNFMRINGDGDKLAVHEEIISQITTVLKIHERSKTCNK